MYEIVNREQLGEAVVRVVINAPQIAKKALAGQFVILRTDENGERIPLTIADVSNSADSGTITLIFQVVGRTTKQLSEMKAGDRLATLAGPLGNATDFGEHVKKACVIGGGVGCAIALPSAKALFKSGVETDVIAGFRNKELVILEKEFAAVSGRLFVTTDDGSYGEKGFVTDKLRSLIETDGKYDLVIAIGPVPMMKFVSAVTRDFGVRTLVSLNPVMIDGTGMCGCCRVTVDGKMRFACVDGPDFDGHLVDFDELSRRNGTYREQERHDADNCRLLREVK